MCREHHKVSCLLRCYLQLSCSGLWRQQPSKFPIALSSPRRSESLSSSQAISGRVCLSVLLVYVSGQGFFKERNLSPRLKSVCGNPYFRPWMAAECPACENEWFFSTGFQPNLQTPSTPLCDSHLSHRLPDPNTVTSGEEAQETQCDP